MSDPLGVASGPSNPYVAAVEQLEADLSAANTSASDQLSRYKFACTRDNVFKRSSDLAVIDTVSQLWEHEVKAAFDRFGHSIVALQPTEYTTIIAATRNVVRKVTGLEERRKLWPQTLIEPYAGWLERGWPRLCATARLRLRSSLRAFERQVIIAVHSAAKVSISDNFLLRLPDGLRSTGDPVEGNPFHSDDPRHKVWDVATGEAEARWCLLNSESRSAQPDGPAGLVDSVCENIAAKYDIWALRGVQVIWSDPDVKAYDQWLVNYAEAWLQDVSAKNLYGQVVPINSLLSNLRLTLTRRVSWWKGEARRYRFEQKAHIAQQNESSAKSEVRPSPGPKKGRPADKMTNSRRLVIRKVASEGFKGEAYCEALAKAGLTTSIRWQKNELCPKEYAQAFNHGDPVLRRKWRNRIADEKYKATRQKPLA